MEKKEKFNYYIQLRNFMQGDCFERSSRNMELTSS